MLREQNLDNAEIARRFNSLIDTSQDRDMRLLGHAGLWMLDNEKRLAAEAPSQPQAAPQAPEIFQLCQHVRIAAAALAEMFDEA